MKDGVNLSPMVILAGLAVLGVGMFVWSRGGVSSAAQAVGGAVVDAAKGATEGVVYGIGDAVGIPRTSETECQKALREGRTWDASFACPATDWLRGTFLPSESVTSSPVATSGRIVAPPPPARDSITDLFLDPYGYSNPI